MVDLISFRDWHSWVAIFLDRLKHIMVSLPYPQTLPKPKEHMTILSGHKPHHCSNAWPLQPQWHGHRLESLRDAYKVD